MAQVASKGVDTRLQVRATKAGLPITGKIYSDFTCSFRKPAASSFSSKTLTSGNVFEVGNGYYDVLFLGASDLNTSGNFSFYLEGASIDHSSAEALIVDVPASTSAATLLACAITGKINDGSGIPVASTTVYARPLAPVTMTGVILSLSTIVTTTDANGVFVLTLIRGGEFEVVAPRQNYVRRLTVPNKPTANLDEIP